MKRVSSAARVCLQPGPHHAAHPARPLDSDDCLQIRRVDEA